MDNNTTADLIGKEIYKAIVKAYGSLVNIEVTDAESDRYCYVFLTWDYLPGVKAMANRNGLNYAFKENINISKVFTFIKK